MEELKKCPFCGGEAAIIIKSNYSDYYSIGFDFIVECEDCRTELPGLHKVRFSLEKDGEINILTDERKEAIEAWNRRTP